MKFQFRRVYAYVDASVVIDTTSVSMGWLNKDEAKALAATLREAARDLLETAEIEDAEPQP